MQRLGLVSVSHPSPLDHFSAEELIAHYSTINNSHPPCTEEALEEIIATPLMHRDVVFAFQPVTELQALEALHWIARGARGRSCDGISLTYLSQSLLIIAPFITRIFNAAISNGRYPTLWRTSTITPVSKVARPQSPAQTRPIANLPHLARACDRLITLQNSAYLEENSLLSPLQSGFRSGYSTQTALLKVTEDIRQAIDKSLVTALVLFDFKCAFDTLNHEVLLRRLHELGFGGLSLRLMHSFLSGRRQAVIGEGGATSSYRTCTSGVPQGSSPGTILFSIFINSLLDVLQHCGTTAMLFADDLQIYLSCEPDKLNDTIARFNADAHSVLQWSRDCGLTLNIPKTQAIVVGSDQRHMRLDLRACSPVQIDGVTVPFQEKPYGGNT
ncbi:unnamed protein product [Trichogramma brassicae]|uniref:Reverse transcriptase domain-containing protein n=1 Tax=Trichogramma brassicae TaxID=86971 RepID=A0A6H5II58_9HYME|nr:unnamed protein product [Trichogramma brassicae]